MEGIVFILDSPAQTLKTHIDKTLWSRVATGLVRGQLTSISLSPQNPEEHAWYGEYESQVVGWLGDGDSYYKNQAAHVAAGTFTYKSSGAAAQAYIENLTQTVLESLEERGFAVAGSPYRLTDQGERARITGLSCHSVTRLEESLGVGSSGWLPTLTNAVTLDQNQRQQISRIVYESTETMANSLWLRKTHKNDPARTAYLTDFARMTADQHLSDEVFWAEVNALSLWMSGASLATIAETMPVFGGSGLFGSSDESSRVSDVAEYVSRIGYPGSWTWTAAHTLARSLHSLNFPTWIAAGVEYGADSETAVGLMRWGTMSRPGALMLAEALGPSWISATEIIREDDSLDLQLAAVDRTRLRTLRGTLQQNDAQS